MIKNGFLSARKPFFLYLWHLVIFKTKRSKTMLDVQAIRKDFPILDHKIYDKPLIYFDNGATTQKPRQVVEKIENGYYNVNANIHRGVHFLSQAATEAHEEARKTVQHFLNARSSNEIIFTRGNYGIHQSDRFQLYG
mgnify:CR=1 FL=1